MIKLQDARIADGLPRVVAEQPWAKVLSAVYGELQGRMLEYLATGMTFSDVDNCSEGMLDQMAIYLKIEWYDSAADIETKRKLVRTAIEIQRYAGTVKAVREQVETIYKKARIEEWFSYGGTPGFWKLYVDITDDQETYHTAAEMEKLLGYTKRCTAHLEHIGKVSPLSKAMPRWHPDGLLAGHFLFAQRLQNNYRLCGAPQTGRKLVFNQ